MTQIDDHPSQDHARRARLAVVVPMANEHATVVPFLSAVTERLGPDDHVFVVIDSVSTDDTFDLVERFADDEPRVHPVWAPEDRSVVDAYFRGYQEALDAGADWILEMDGGMSHDPGEIPRFVAQIGEGYDYVGGCRFMPGGSHVGSLRRRLVSRGGSAAARVALGAHMRDMTGGFEMFSREAIQRVLDHGVRSRANFFQTEIKFLMKDMRWTEVPINYRCTNGRVPQGSLKEAFRNLRELRRERAA